MAIDTIIATLARDATQAHDEARAQQLARRIRAAILREVPGDLPQSQFLCTMAAVLGRFVRDMADTNGARPIAETLARQVVRHAVDEG